MKSFAAVLMLVSGILSPAIAAEATPDPSQAAHAVNALGLNLLRASDSNSAPANLLLSPYSVQNALAMTWAGAAGVTWKEMACVLDFGTNETALHASLTALGGSLDEYRRRTEAMAAEAKKNGHPSDPVSLVVANRLFGQKTYDFRPAFLKLTRDRYGAPLEAVDFIGHAEESRLIINQWVTGQTRDRIRDLIPAGALTVDTRLVLVNAIYLKAPWGSPFQSSRTRREPFRVHGTNAQPVATMNQREHVGYRHQDGFSAITLPYIGDELQFLILLPDSATNLPSVEKSLTPRTLDSCARLPRVELDLHLPKLHLQPPVMALGKTLRTLGMTTAFNVPVGSADFSRMATRRELWIDDVFHKTFLDLDEHGTEAAAATAVTMVATSAPPNPKPKPIVVRVDRPFLFAIQHRSSGACLFLGRMMDPR